MPESVVILGSGNVSWHLAESFSLQGYDVLQVYGRKKKDSFHFEDFRITEFITEIEYINPTADIYFLCVNDDAIEEVISRLRFRLNENQIIVHTSGALPSTVLKPYCENYGCFWPVQTLTKGGKIISNEIPIVITASNEFTLASLLEMADQISSHFEVMNDVQKSKLHLAAVMVNNFSNHLYSLTADFCKAEKIEFELLTSLIKETGLKLEKEHPSILQTGPAMRNDKRTIEKQLKILENHTLLYKLYCIFTDSIIQKYHKT